MASMIPYSIYSAQLIIVRNMQKQIQFTQQACVIFVCTYQQNLHKTYSKYVNMLN